MKINRCLMIGLLCSLLTITLSCSSKEKIIKQSQNIRRVGEAYLSKGDYSGALKNFLDAEAIYSDDYLLHDDLGKAYVGKRKYDLAINHFKRSIELKPDYAPGKNNLGSAYLLAEQWDEAIEVFKQLNENLLYATPHYPMYNLGWAYYNKKDYETAIKYYNKALKIQHGFILALRGLGLVYMEMGDTAKAIKYFEKAAKTAPKFPQLYFDMGTAYTTTKQYEKAIEAFKKVIEIKPASDISDNAKEKIAHLKKLL